MLTPGHSILGDEFYASEAVFGQAERLLLHASVLGFRHPITGVELSFDKTPAF